MSGVQGPSRLLNHAHSLTVVRMVSLPRFGSLCHLRWQQPTGLTLPFAPLPGFGAEPQALCRSTRSERFEWPKVTRNAGRFY